MRLPSLKIFLTTFLFCCYFLVSAQYQIPEKPSILWPVHDTVGLLSESEKQELNQKLIKFEDSTSTEIEVIIIPTTNGEDVNFVATQFGEKWGIGKKKVDNGVVFLIATEDHKMSIQQGRAVEQYLTASVAGQILDYLVTPYFKQGEWYEGINHGTSAIMDAVKGKFKPIEKSSEGVDFSITHIIIILLILFFLFYILSKNNNNGGGRFGDDDDVIITRKGRRVYPGGFFPFPTGGSFGGGFGGGSSGGGFGGGFGGFGGGGSFGGGGASGGW